MCRNLQYLERYGGLMQQNQSLIHGLSMKKVMHALNIRQVKEVTFNYVWPFNEHRC